MQSFIYVVNHMLKMHALSGAVSFLASSTLQ